MITVNRKLDIYPLLLSDIGNEQRPPPRATNWQWENSPPHQSDGSDSAGEGEVWAEDPLPGTTGEVDQGITAITLPFSTWQLPVNIKKCPNPSLDAPSHQIAQYRDQIREYRNRSSAVAADVRRVRMSMTDSLHNIGTHPRVSTAALESEIQVRPDQLFGFWQE